MKYLCLLAIILIAGCSITEIDTGLQFETIGNACFWVARNVKYSYDVHDEWQTPEETLASLEGDCEDFAILLIYLVKESLDIEMDAIVYFYNGTLHMAVFHEDILWEPTCGFGLNSDSDWYQMAMQWYYLITYDELMFTATYLRSLE